MMRVKSAEPSNSQLLGDDVDQASEEEGNMDARGLGV